MQKETISALKRVEGIRLVVVAIVDFPDQDQAQKLCEALTLQNCTILMTINEWGLDKEGMITTFCAQHNIMQINWCADDPFFMHVFHGNKLQPSANRIDFVTDRSYVSQMKTVGFKAHFLPLATDPFLFSPRSDCASFERTSCFVGSSYNKQIESFTKGCEPLIDSLVPFITSALMQYKKNRDINLSALIAEKVAHSQLPQGISYDKATFIIKHVVSYFYRKKLIISLCNSFSDFMVYGDEWWLLDIPKEKISTAVGYYINLNDTYRKTKVNIDINRVVIREGLTQRIFDCLACGSFIITDRKAIVPEFFSTHGPFAEVIMFDDDKHAKELILYYAKNDTERDAIVERGRNRVLSEHTYDHRIGTIFKVLSGELGTRAI